MLFSDGQTQCRVLKGFRWMLFLETGLFIVHPWHMETLHLFSVGVV